jgi:tRNA A37 threonylcarbamoyltransferase TsaD
LRRITEDLSKIYKIPSIYAPPNMCTDNAAMIAWLGWELINAE